MRRGVVAAAALLALAACTRKAPPAPVSYPVAPALGSAPGLAEAVPTAPARRASANPDAIVVKPGQTLFAISREYDVPIRSLIERNGLAPPFALKAGQRLALPRVETHVVQPGETLYAVSRRYGVDASELARVNEIAPPYTIKIGTALILPASIEPARASGAPLVAGRPAPPPTAEPPSRVDTSPIRPPEPAGAPPVPLAPPPLVERTVPERTGPERTVGAAAEPAVPSSANAPEGSLPAVSAPLPAAPPAVAAQPEGATAPLRSGRFDWPVRGRLLAAFGPGASGTHNDGVNIAAPMGTPILAADDGEVAYVGNEIRGFGNLVLVKHAEGWITAYAHCEAITVKRRDRVRRGQAIARVGASGGVAEPQLHFEVRKGTRALDPAAYLGPLSTSRP